MTATLDWIIEQMDCYPEKDGRTDVVFTVYWRLNAVDGEHVGTVYGSVGLTLDPDANFMPYSELTKDQVVGWVKSALGDEQVKSYEDGVLGQIETQKNPPVVRPALPW